ncbi:MAG: HAMP domain-containing sensor histidine kinase [Neobacillus sp.]
MYFYLISFLLIVVTSVILLTYGKSNPYSLWTGLLFLLGSFAHYSYMIQDTILPFLDSSQGLYVFLVLSCIPSLYIHFYFLGYTFLASAFYFSDYLSLELRKMLVVCLFIPIPLILSVSGDFTLPVEISLPSLRFLVHFYSFLGIILFLLILKKKRRNPGFLRNVLYVVLLIFYMAAENISYYSIQSIRIDRSGLILQKNYLWDYNYIYISILAFLLIGLGITQGIWGIQVRIERAKQEYSLKALTEGTNILNHTIKNEIQKIHYMCERSMMSISEHKPEHAQKLLADIKEVSLHLMEMSERIKEKSDDIHLKVSRFPLRETIESVLAPFVSSHDGIRVEKIFSADGEMFADEWHVREVLNNLLQNSIDALQGKDGVLTVTTKVIKKRLYIEVKDNGEGIPPDRVKKIFEPFFTTKKNSLNYGLGLSYCCNVLRKHGGSLQLTESTPGHGTTMAMIFPPACFTQK